MKKVYILQLLLQIYIWQSDQVLVSEVIRRSEVLQREVHSSTLSPSRSLERRSDGRCSGSTLNYEFEVHTLSSSIIEP